MKHFIKKYLVLITAILIGTQYISAKNIIETLVLNDGSKLQGYISEQSSSYGIDFYAERSYICVPSSSITMTIEKRISYNDLPSIWKEFVKEDKNILGRNNSLVLTDIYLIQSGFADTLAIADSAAYSSPTLMQISDAKQIRILEKGENTLYLDLTPRSYHYDWDDVKEILSESPDYSLINGIETELILDNDRLVSGSIVSQKPGDQIYILTNDGIVESIQSDRINIIRRKPKFDNQDILKQTQILESIQLNDNKNITGIIIEQNFIPQSDGSTYMTIETSDGSKYNYKHEQVIKISKIINPDYKPIYDVVMGNNKCIVENDSLGAFSTIFVTHGIVYTNDDPIATFSLSSLFDRKIRIFVKNTTENNNFKLIKLTNQQIEKKKKNSPVAKGFNFEEFAISAISPSLVYITPSNTLAMEFDIIDNGDYMFYQAKDKLGIYIRVT